MGDAENDLHPSKKRSAGRELSRDNPGLDEDDPEPELGTFQRASEEVLATRRIVKVRRHQTPAVTSSPNPFAGISLAPSTSAIVNTTSSVGQPQQVDDNAVLEQQDGTIRNDDKTDDDKGTENGVAMGEPNGAEENTQSAKRTVAVDEVSDRDKNDVVGDATGIGEGDKEAGYKGQGTENEGREATEKIAAEEETEKEAEEMGEKAREESENVVREETVKEVGEAAEKEKEANDQTDTAEQAVPLNSFRQLCSNQNAFTGLAGTGFSSFSFSFGTLSKEGSAFSKSSGPLFGVKNENSSIPSFGLGSFNNGSSSSQLFGSAASDATKSGVSGSPSMPEVPLETGEENEKAAFNADAVLFEYLDGGWKERGKGELKVNVSVLGDGRARLVMRARGNYRLVLNASLYPDMLLTDMNKRGVTFACVNSASEGKGGLTTFALKFKDGAIKEEFREVVTAHKGKKDSVLKTPENSPKASDD